MINLEDFIKKSKNTLDSEKPSVVHEYEFEKKLNARFHKKDSFIIRYAIGIAASVLVFISISIFIYKTRSEGYTGAVETSQWIEFVEAEQYYSEQTNKAYYQLKETLASQPAEVTTPLFDELKDMETSYKQLKKDLNNNPNDIRLMSAVVQYYQLKLELINNLTDRFTLYSNIKIKQHEKSNI